MASPSQRRRSSLGSDSLDLGIGGDVASGVATKWEASPSRAELQARSDVLLGRSANGSTGSGGIVGGPSPTTASTQQHAIRKPAGGAAGGGAVEDDLVHSLLYDSINVGTRQQQKQAAAGGIPDDSILVVGGAEKAIGVDDVEIKVEAGATTARPRTSTSSDEDSDDDLLAPKGGKATGASKGVTPTTDGASKNFFQSAGAGSSTAPSPTTSQASLNVIVGKSGKARIGIPIACRTYVAGGSVQSETSGVTPLPPRIPTPPPFAGTPDDWYFTYQHEKLGVKPSSTAPATPTTATTEAPEQDGEEKADNKKEKKEKKGGFGSRLTKAFTNLGHKLEKHSYQVAYNAEVRLREKDKVEGLKRLYKYFPNQTPTSFIVAQKKALKKEREEAAAAAAAEEKAAKKEKKEKEKKEKADKKKDKKGDDAANVAGAGAEASTMGLADLKDDDGSMVMAGSLRYEKQHQQQAANGNAVGSSPLTVETGVQQQQHGDPDAFYLCAFEVEVLHDGTPIPGHAILTSRNLCIVAKGKAKAVTVSAGAASPGSKNNASNKAPALVVNSLQMSSSADNSYASGASPSRWDRQAVQQMQGGTRATEPFADEDEVLAVITGRSATATPMPPPAAGGVTPQHHQRTQSVISNGAPTSSTAAVHPAMGGGGGSQQSPQTTTGSSGTILVLQVIPLDDIVSYNYGLSMLSHDTKKCSIVLTDAPDNNEQNSTIAAGNGNTTAAHLQPDSLQIYLRRWPHSSSSEDTNNNNTTNLPIVELRKFLHHVSNTQQGVTYMADGHAHVSFVQRFICYLLSVWVGGSKNGSAAVAARGAGPAAKKRSSSIAGEGSFADNCKPQQEDIFGGSDDDNDDDDL